MTRATFRKCGYRSPEFAHYDPDGGCGNSNDYGCDPDSTVFGFLTHSDEHTPEIMQGSRAITFDDCGRRFRLHNHRNNEETVSGRGQNWLDVDGSVSQLGQTTIIGSGLPGVSEWWGVGDAGEFLLPVCDWVACF